ncbi:MAG TPA: lantibiotic ABC transporter permease [Clostridiales bacterium UBA8960]|nr:lantibiotic ABC transporter permease [Clostridiales bacterium UBA8960]
MAVKKKIKNMGMKTVVVVTYLAMILINTLANVLPINNITTGAVSAKYENLFTPSGFTFSIWLIIYLVLGAHVFYQFKDVFYSPETRAMVQKHRKWFSISSVANTLWILAWHYDFVFLSVLLMFTILFSLLRCMRWIGSAKLTSQERLWIKKPFSIYLGWILVATIANMTVLFVKWDWQFWGISESAITGTILLIGMVISGLSVLKFKDSLIGAVVLWAYYGILVKHIGVKGFNQMYPSVVNITIASIAGIISVMIYNSYHRIEALKQKYLK